MTPETLEQLLTDRALGQLSPEVSALLEAYLAHHPEAREEAEAVAGVVSLAKAAVGGGEVRALPAFDMRGRQAAVRRRRVVRFVGVGLGMAASVAMGFVLARALTPVAPPAAPGVTIAQVPTVVEPAGAAGARPGGFWSAERLQSLGQRPEPARRAAGESDMAAKAFRSIGG